MNTKVCTKCGREFPATTEYFYKGNARLGLQSQCKECVREYAREYRREYYQNNRERVSEYHREYRQNNHEKVLEQKREYRQANREKGLEYAQEWYRANRERVLERAKEWRENNREKVCAASTNRRARLFEAEGSHTFADIADKYDAQHGKCFYCGCDLNYEFHVDHFYPLSKGGSNAPSNLVIACQFCNLSKHDKMPEEFIASLPNRVWN